MFYIIINMDMSYNVRKIIRIIVAVIWVIGAAMYGMKGDYLFSGLFALIGIVFLVKGLKSER